MNKVIFDYSKETSSEIVGVSKKRMNQLEKLSEKSLWELQNPDRDGFTEFELLEAFVKHAETPGEIAIQAFIAGQYINNEFPQDDILEEETYEDECN